MQTSQNLDFKAQYDMFLLAHKSKQLPKTKPNFSKFVRDFKIFDTQKIKTHKNKIFTTQNTKTTHVDKK